VERKDAITVAVEDLKARGLISQDVRIIVKEQGASEILPISTNLPKKQIVCSCDMNALDENQLRFCMLHEYAHIVLYPQFMMQMGFAVSIWIAAFILLLRADLTSLLAVGPVYLLGRVIFSNVTYRYELAADHRAGQLIKAEFEVKCPSEVLHLALFHVRNLKGKRLSKAEFFLKVIGYKHPKDLQREMKVAEKLDEIICRQ